MGRKQPSDKKPQPQRTNNENATKPVGNYVVQYLVGGEWSEAENVPEPRGRRTLMKQLSKNSDYKPGTVRVRAV